MLWQRQSFFAIFLAVGLILFLVLRTSDDSLKEVLGERGIRIGYAFEPPYAFTTGSGEVTGQSPVIAKRVALKLGVKNIEWIQTSFASLISELESGRIDVIAAGMIITKDREARVAFSRTVFQVKTELLVRAGNPLKIHSVEDIVNKPKIQIAILAGAMEYEWLRGEGVSDNQILLVPDAIAGLASVQAGLADGLALTGPTIRGMAVEGAGVEMALPFITRDSLHHQGAFAFRKSSVKLREAWDRELEKYVGTEEHINEMNQFGFQRDEVACKLSVEEPAAICSNETPLDVPPTGERGGE